MINDTMKRLDAARAKVSALEANLATERSKELASLPARYGFSSAAEFAKAVRAAGGGGSGAGRVKAAKAGGGSGKRHRAVITSDTKSQVKTLVEGGKTGAEIAKVLQISLPSVQNIKKELGLVKARKKK
ncbi:helix-turn-helix domain-containing protein [Horticoccus luteus]|uniref:Helix-turn-helix domain-containing protein n=1 Tax=Horticoccus luteus TaxID=2862869 RepID=A0A8F9TZ28_9BACT|nr:helix-turn-helix domain-containing protein [Horticoccus luteus]QYM80388.1 helix-turn-helix domain-containing protein [Horticoccus luteus]